MFSKSFSKIFKLIWKQKVARETKDLLFKIMESEKTLRSTPRKCGVGEETFTET